MQRLCTSSRVPWQSLSAMQKLTKLTASWLAMLNEMQIGDPGLGLMRKLVETRPKYDLGILALRTLMQSHGLQLDKQSDNNCELVDLFNSDATEEEFLTQLKVCREKAPKAIAYLIRRIKKQEFNEEQSIEE